MNKRVFDLLLALAILCSVPASAQQIVFGTNTSGLASSAGVDAFAGFQVGANDVTDGLGLRGTLDLAAGVATGLPVFQLAADVFYHTGSDILFYAGGGGGLISAPGVVVPFVEAVVGVDFDAATTLSYFIEAQPRYYFAGLPAIAIRSGLNIHIDL